MTTWITVCETCKHEDWQDRGVDVTDGDALATLVEAATDTVDGDVKMRRHSCLMGCKMACNITIQAEDKLCYTLPNFDPVEGDAEAIVGFAALHSQSDTGQVPYKSWPDGVKGHFTTRHPPLPKSE